MNPGPMPLRVAIVGNSGSGKSTLARRLAERHPAPVLDLDTLAWAREGFAVPRDPAEAAADVVEFCSINISWVIEGCYGNLIAACLRFEPHLLFLEPGAQQCLANCRSRPWEPHKYQTKEEQDKYLEPLLAWVAAYYERKGDMSLAGHEALFEAYAGPKQRLSAISDLRVLDFF